MTTHPLQIAICGSAVGEREDIREAAREIGRLLAKSGCIVLSGATGGYPGEAALAAQQAGGLSIGISPAADRDEHGGIYAKPTDGFGSIVYTGFGYEGRNVILVRSADAVIFIGGRIGTVNEFTAAFQIGKVIGVLEGSSDNADLLPTIAINSGKAGGPLVVESDPEILVKNVLELVATKSVN